MPHIRLKALVVASNPEQLRVWRRALAGLGMEMDESRSAADAAEKMARGKYEALAVDCEDVAGSTGLFMAVRSAPTSHHAIVFAMTSGGRLSSLRGCGVNFILTKPLNAEFLGRCLRASYGSMMADQQRYYRYPVEIEVTLECDGRRWQGRITNLSEGGLRVVADGLADHQKVRLHFLLPGTESRMDAGATIVWCGGGTAGLRFENLLPSRRAVLSQWLRERMEAAGSPLPTVAIVP
jgi:CheY-like chemotaxis protein